MVIDFANVSVRVSKDIRKLTDSCLPNVYVCVFVWECVCVCARVGLHSVLKVRLFSAALIERLQLLL